MSRKIAGLDIGSHSVKVVLARERLGRIDLLQFYEKPIANNNIQEVIRAIFREKGLHPDIIVSSVSGSAVSVHYLQIPFSDENKITQVIPYEVESLVPFPLEEMIIDQFVLAKSNGTAANNGSSVCVALIRKSALQHYINTLKGVHIDPKIIELESLALYHAFMQWYKTEDTVALLDIGASKSNLCIAAKGKPRLVRTFYRGGNGITTAIQETMGTGCSFNDAEQKKISTGILYDETAEGHEQSADISSAIKRGLTPLLTELQQSLHAYEIQQGDSITRLYMAGGGARLLNLDKFLQSALEIEVEPFRVPADIIHKLTGREEARFVIPTGMGLALRGAVHKKPVLGLNFRKGESFYKKEGKETTVRLIYMMIAVVAVVLLGSTDFYFRYHHREAKYKDIKSEIRKVYMETFPEARNVVDENQQLKSAVDELRKKVAALGGGAGRGMTSLDLLNTLTEKIPKDITVNIDDLMMDKSKIKVQGNTDSFENVERIKREFETIPFFKKVEVSDAKLAADQKRVKFRIIVDL
ncbi:MAG: pilus assembly protein PilM [Nitrospirae bacterium]|nr:pilus assembly protein PilM [Nitrospirota bacterium]